MLFRSGLAQWIEEAGLTQAKVAREIGASTTQVSRVLAGERTDQETESRITEFLIEFTGQAGQPADTRKIA